MPAISDRSAVLLFSPYAGFAFVLWLAVDEHGEMKVSERQHYYYCYYYYHHHYYYYYYYYYYYCYY